MPECTVWIDEWPARNAVRIFASLTEDDPEERARMREAGFTWDCGTLQCVCPLAEMGALLRTLFERDYRLVPYLDRRVELQLLRDVGLQGGELTFYRREESVLGIVSWSSIYAFE